MNRKPRKLAIFAACAIATGLAACADNGTDDTAKTKNSALEATLVNGEFAPTGGGWTGDGFTLDRGCAVNNPVAARPSLGGWTAASLTFGRSAATVRQEVVIPKPTAVTFAITGNLNANDPNGWFKIDLNDADEKKTTDRQTGTANIEPKAFTLSVTTTSPNEKVRIVLSGSGRKLWMGCYGPVLTKPLLTGLGISTPTTTSSTTTSTTTSTTSTTTTTTTSTTTTLPPTTTTTTKAPGCADLKWDRNANCENANLRGFDFRTKQILYGNFRGADLSGADLRWTNLYGSDFSGANLTGALLTGANGRGGKYIGANFTDAKFEGADFGMSDFTGANMTNGHLFRAKFDQANFTRANLTAAYIFCTHFSSVNLTGANIDRAIFDGVLMLGTIMPDGTRKSSSGTVPWCLR